jgi:hypothetical protein
MMLLRIIVYISDTVVTTQFFNCSSTPFNTDFTKGLFKMRKLIVIFAEQNDSEASHSIHGSGLHGGQPDPLKKSQEALDHRLT